jgi:hypothetical protein
MATREITEAAVGSSRLLAREATAWDDGRRPLRTACPAPEGQLDRTSQCRRPLARDHRRRRASAQRWSLPPAIREISEAAQGSPRPLARETTS